MSWPNRVWEPTGETEEGKTTWKSREPTREDHERRRRIDSEASVRITKRELKKIGEENVVIGRVIT